MLNDCVPDPAVIIRERMSIHIQYIQLGKPQQNAYSER